MKKSILTLGTALAFLTLSPLTAQAQQAMHNPNAIEWDMRGGDKKIKLIEADTPSGHAISAYVKKRKTNPWDTTLFFDLDKGVEKGDRVSVELWVRTAKAPKSQENAEFVLYVGRNEEPWDRIISEDVLPGSEWEKLTIEGVSEGYYPKGEVKVEFQLAKYKQTLEFGPILVKNLGPATN